MNQMHSSEARIRMEDAMDATAIRRVYELAFGRRAEADIVDAAQAVGAPVLSMVALGEDGGVIAHVLVTPVAVTTEEGEVGLVGLGPVAVLPSEQSRGVGTQLIETCLERLRESGHPGVVVAGNPGYYSRFGFIAASRWGLRWEADAPDEVCMALELTPGGLAGVRGTVRYRPEFAAPATP
jgi:putative acetyltransferase